MLFFIVDNAIWFYFLLGIAAIGLLYYWYTERKSVILIGVFGVLALLLAVFLLSLFVVSDRVRIRNIVQEMAQSAELKNRNPEKLISHLSPKFRFKLQGNRFIDKQSAAQALRTWMNTFGFDQVYVSQFKIAMDSSGKAADVEFMARLEAKVGMDLSRIKARFELEDNDQGEPVWRMVECVRWHPLRDEENPPPSP